MACTCQNACSSCGPQGTGCACPKGQCSCNNCVNKANSCACDGISACECAKSGKACSCGK
ncbi:hypothetical protein BD413DRAFT_469833 [Trametes elegans]|nr:hypothetical protein BD413DRAFT_469833 [Trametes elegans]